MGAGDTRFPTVVGGWLFLIPAAWLLGVHRGTGEREDPLDPLFPLFPCVSQSLVNLVLPASDFLIFQSGCGSAPERKFKRAAPF
jgi:hypothetical protein